jgi:hypothetical protein
VRLLHRQAGELDGVLETGHDERPHDAVDRRLGVDRTELVRGRARSIDKGVEALVGLADGKIGGASGAVVLGMNRA